MSRALQNLHGLRRGVVNEILRLPALHAEEIHDVTPPFAVIDQRGGAAVNFCLSVSLRRRLHDFDVLRRAKKRHVAPTFLCHLILFVEDDRVMRHRPRSLVLERVVPEVTEIGEQLAAVLPVGKIEAVLMVMAAPAARAEEQQTLPSVGPTAHVADAEIGRTKIRQRNPRRRFLFEPRLTIVERERRVTSREIVATSFLEQREIFGALGIVGRHQLHEISPEPRVAI